jgi:hypothetical protein
MKADISHITAPSTEGSTVSGLSIDFKNLGGVSLRERSKLEADLRNISFLLNGKKTSIKEASELDSKTRGRIHESWKFATVVAQSFILDAAFKCQPHYLGTAGVKNCKKFSVNEKTRRLGHTNFEYLSAVCFHQFDEDEKHTGKELEGALKISGTFTRGLLGFGHVCTMKATLSFQKNPEIKESEIRDFLTQLKQFYFHDPLIFKKKLEANVRRRLTAAFLLSVAAVTPALIFSIVPLLSGLGLAIPLIGLVGAGIALASFALLFGVTAAVYAIYYKLAKDQPKIKEVEINLTSYDFLEPKVEAENQSIIMKLRIPLLATVGLSSAIVTPLLILTLIPLFSTMGLPTLAIAGIGAGISLATLGILFSASVGIRALSKHIFNFSKPPPARTDGMGAITEPSIAQRAESTFTQNSSLRQDPTGLDFNSIFNTASTATYTEASDAGGLPQDHIAADEEERSLSPANSTSSSLA